MTPKTVDISTGFVTWAFNPHKLRNDGSPAAHYQVGKSNINKAIEGKSNIVYFIFLQSVITT